MSNIALVVLDTLRKDAFEEHFDWLPGHRFENAWSTSHWTVPAHASLFTGKYASEIGAVAKAPALDCSEPVLAEVLRNAGFTTRAFSTNPNIAPDFEFDRGFQEFEGNWRLETPHKDEIFDWGRHLAGTELPRSVAFCTGLVDCIAGDYDLMGSLRYGFRKFQRSSSLGGIDDDGAQAALEYLRSTDFDRPEFCFINLMEAHSPYQPPESYRTVDISDNPFVGGMYETIVDSRVDPEPHRRAYADCVRYLSDIYLEIFEELKRNFDHIVTVSDHGELFGEHGVWRHGYGVYPELVSVPVSIYSGQDSITRSDELVSLADLFDVIVHAGTVETDRTVIDLLQETGRSNCLTEFHGITHQRKVEKLKSQGIDREVLDEYEVPLAGVAMESSYGYETSAGFSGSDDLKKELASVKCTLSKRAVSETDVVETDSLEQLEKLGYL